MKTVVYTIHGVDEYKGMMWHVHNGALYIHEADDIDAPYTAAYAPGMWYKAVRIGELEET